MAEFHNFKRSYSSEVGRYGSNFLQGVSLQIKGGHLSQLSSSLAFPDLREISLIF